MPLHADEFQGGRCKIKRRARSSTQASNAVTHCFTEGKTSTKSHVVRWTVRPLSCQGSVGDGGMLLGQGTATWNPLSALLAHSLGGYEFPEFHRP
eukprot:3022019-Rhodomonas_salina.1